MRALAEADGALVIQAPLWIGIALILVGIVLMVAVFVPVVPPRPKRLMALLGTILLVVAGWHLTAARTTFEPRGFYTESIYGEDVRVGWLQVGNVSPGPGGDLVVQLRSGGEVSVDLSGLSAEQQARVASYARSRVKP